MCWEVVAEKFRKSWFSHMKPLYFCHNRELCTVKALQFMTHESWIWAEMFSAIFFWVAWYDDIVVQCMSVLCSEPWLQWTHGIPHMGVQPRSHQTHYPFEFELIFELQAFRNLLLLQIFNGTIFIYVILYGVATYSLRSYAGECIK